MGSEHLGEELGRLSGQLQTLVPALEHMEGRERETITKITAIETKAEALKKDYDELVKKLSQRLKDIYGRLSVIEASFSGLGPVISDIKTKDVFARLGTAETALAKIEKGRANIWKKFWDVSKILITIALTAVATRYLGGGKP